MNENSSHVSMSQRNRVLFGYAFELAKQMGADCTYVEGDRIVIDHVVAVHAPVETITLRIGASEI